MKLLFWLTLASSWAANAGVFTETFTSTAQKDSSTLIWNTELGYLHPELKIYGYSDGVQAVASSTVVPVGDGSDGAFDSAVPSTYAAYATLNGNVITVDASIRPVLNLTRFHLDATKVLTSINGPLVIYSLSTVMIEGVINCSGGNGASTTTAVGGAGGIGRCGGRNGGAGGNAATSGSNGQAGLANPGLGGVYTNGANPGSGGGGGSGYRDHSGQAGISAGANTGGAGGAQLTNVDHGFFILDGSAGGGGGSGSLTEGGGGGGAGGGTVVIHAVDDVTIAVTGAILADGGNGGDSGDGGGGGAGAGGNVKLFTTGNFLNNSIISVNPMNVGAPLNPAAGDGGQGSRGRAWIVVFNYDFTSIGSETDTSSLPPASQGTIGYVSGTPQIAISKSFDTGSVFNVYQSITSNPVDSDISFEVAGSNDDFVLDDTGWVSSTAIASISNKRYVKYKVILNNSNAVNPTTVDDVTLSYVTMLPVEPTNFENFSFKSAGCGTVKSTAPPKSNWLLSFLILMPLLVALKLRRPKTVQVLARK